MAECNKDAHDMLAQLWRQTGLPASALDSISMTGSGQEGVPSTFRLGDAAAASIGAAALAASLLQSTRTSDAPLPRVTLSTKSAFTAFRSEQLARLNGELKSIWDDLAGIYRTKDGFIRPHTNWPHHRVGALSVVGLPRDATRQQLEAAYREFLADEVAEKAMRQGLPVTAMRSFDDWDTHPQGKAAAARTGGPVKIERFGSGRPRKPLVRSEAKSLAPLAGLRVLDMTRVIAGPVAGRTLAAYGADVMWITSPNNPSLPNLDFDTSRGKRTTQLDLRQPADRDVFVNLVREADVVLQAYRPGGLGNLGFSYEELRVIHPDIVYATLSAYGPDGPWSDRKGFDSLVQFAVGINEAEGQAWREFKSLSGAGSYVDFEPKTLPCQALDHGAGYLMAFAVQAALYRRAVEGGSFKITLSLLSVATWIRNMGRLPIETFDQHLATFDELKQDGLLLDTMTRRDGSEVTFVRHPAEIEGVEVGWTRAPVGLREDLPTWLESE